MESNPEIIDSEDLEWGYEIPQLFVQRVKANLPFIGGLEKEKVLKGHVFERILNDDRGQFGTAALWHETGVMKPERAIEHQTILLNRLRWEEEQSQTPQEIKDAIAELRKRFEGKGWDKKENLAQARADWEKMMYLRVKTMIASNQDGANDALEEYYRYTDEVAKRGLSL